MHTLIVSPSPATAIEVGLPQEAPEVSAGHGLHPDPDVIVFNLKRRHTGVSSTVNALVPFQTDRWNMGYCGTTMSNGVEGMSAWRALWVSRKAPAQRTVRIWHVRRDPEMMLGIWARDVLRLPIRLVFTSAAQHRHGAFPRWLISKMDAVISTTAKAASFVPNTTAVVPHGVDLKRFAVPPDRAAAWREGQLPGRYGIGCFGRLRPDKGTDVFVHSMIRALPGLPGAHAVVAGQARPEHALFLEGLKADIARAGLEDRFTFLGEVDAGSVAAWYQRCRLVVACPRYEPFGLTPFEAAATGAVLVCSRTGAFEQLVEPGVNGLLVPTGDAPALATAVLDALSTPEGAEAMGTRARALVVERFSLEAEASGIDRVYRQVFEQAPALQRAERWALGAYGAMTVAFQPLFRLKLLRRAKQEAPYGWRVPARFGHYETPPCQGPLWIHAVSLGETRVAATLIEALRRERPGLRILLTHATASGWTAGQALLREGDRQEWLPWDTADATARFLEHHAPEAGVMMETEVWPMMVNACAQRHIPLFLANARKSASSFNSAWRMRWLARPAYRRLQGALVQSEADASRLSRLGTHVLAQTGNIKFDAKPSEDQLAVGRLWRGQGQKPVVMLASARHGEALGLLDAFMADPGARESHQILIVPRHLHHMAELLQAIEARGLSVSRRSAWAPHPAAADVWLGDTFGELPSYYALADVALLGGSFAPLGGQNLIEAAACGCPLVVGPHTFNFEDASQWAITAGAARRALDMSSAWALARDWASDTSALQSARRLALGFAAEHGGAAHMSAVILMQQLA